MKKIVSSALVVAVVATSVPLQTFANTNIEDSIKTVNQKVQGLKRGNIEVDINFGLPVYNKAMGESKMKLSLSKGEEVIAEVPLGSDNTNHSFEYDGATYNYRIERLNFDRSSEVGEGEKMYYCRVVFENLPAGVDANYGVSLEGKGFKDSSVSNIELNDYSQRVLIGNTLEEDDKVQNGAILFGDVDGNGEVNTADYDAVLFDIANKENNKDRDLNRDGKVNIVDLTYVQRNLDKSQGAMVVESTDVIVDTTKVNIDNATDAVEGQQINGSVEDLFGEEGSVSVSLPSEVEMSEDTPAKLDINLKGATSTYNVEEGTLMEQIVIKGGVNAPKTGSVVVDGVEYPFALSESQVRSGATDIVVDLESQKAVSKITINVTSTTTNDRNLVDIAKVQFLNNVYKEIPKPDMNIPMINDVKTSTKVAHESMEITWDREQNVTGYEVKVEEIDENGKVKGKARLFRTSEEYLKVRDIKAYARYRVSIQSVNGEWQGGYKEADSSDLDGLPDNIEHDSIASGMYVPKAIEKDSIVEIMVIPEEKPEPPEGISVKGKYKALEVSWKKHNSAQSFDVYYRKNGTKSDFIKANSEPIKNTTNYTIGELEEGTYEVKLTATNHLGTSGMSKGYMGTTSSIRIPNSPNYNLINLPQGVNSLTKHIESVEFPKGADDGHLDIFDEDSVVDNDYSTAWTINDWDSGQYSKRGPIITFDEEYTIDTIGLIARLDSVGSNPYLANIGVWNEDTQKWDYIDARIQTIDNNGTYNLLKLDEPITTKKIQVNASVYGAKKLSISELKFYKYDSIEKDIKDLFEDDLQIELRKSKEVTQGEIDSLRERVNTKDANTNEYHPNRETLLKELQVAEDILNDKEISEKVITIDPNINNGGKGIGFNNDWQSLGFSAKAGDTINVYVATSDANREIHLGVEQHYGESGAFMSSEKIVLRPGKNTIQIPKLHDLNVEKGGNLYVRFPYSGDFNTQVKVRVSGATELPHLNLNNYLEDVDALSTNTDVDTVKEVKGLLKDYILNLKDYVDRLPSMYKSDATEDDNNNNIYSYDEKTSILNSTNIEGDRFTLTLPSTQVYKGISKGIEGDIDAQVDRLFNTVLAWEQLMQITMAKKGVYEEVADFNGSGEIDAEDRAEFNRNQAPNNRLNVKYQRMFIGAFMYASGHHVGVDFDSTADLMTGVPYKFDSEGNVTNPDEAKLFGWGISHEVGHKTDIGNRTYSETTNNILALITQTFDGEDKSRLEMNGYDKIYERVTSGSIGVSQDISVLLGMFWQLHLAYEQNPTSHMIKNNSDNDPTNDSYFAKMNRAYRHTTAETKDKDQLLIRRASDAAGKDLRGFFASWGLIADESTSIYLQQKFPNAEDKETRKIQYLNDEAFRQRLAGVEDMATDTEVTANFVGVKPNSIVQDNKITLSMDVNKDKDKILGYEILRSDGNINTEEGTKVAYKPIGFVEAKKDGATTYIDDIAPLNNRAFTYKVVAYDYNLNTTNEYEIGSVKLSHDGTVDSSKMHLKSNMIATNEDMSLENIKDGDESTVFRGRKMTSDEYNKNPHKEEGVDLKSDPYVIMDLNGSKNIVGLKYTKSTSEPKKFSLKRLFSKNKEVTYNTIDGYEVYISNNNKDWEKVSQGNMRFGQDTVLGGKDADNVARVTFTDNSGKNIWSHEARYVKLVAKGGTNIEIADLEVLSEVGDNIEIGVIDSNTQVRENGIGKLSHDYVVQEDDESTTDVDESVVIPQGSIVVMGDYKGNPAFNVPLLIDENNRTISGEVVLMANVPEDAPLGDVAKGKWVYWIPEESYSSLSGKVKAELYRYNALNEEGSPVGQRLISDTLYVDVPGSNYDELPSITLENSAKVKGTKTSVVHKKVNDSIRKGIK